MGRKKLKRDKEGNAVRAVVERSVGVDVTVMNLDDLEDAAEKILKYCKSMRERFALIKEMAGRRQDD